MRQQGLARAGWPDEQYVALRQFDFITLADVLEPLVVVIDRNRKYPLRGFLPDYIRIQNPADFLRRWQIGLRGLAGFGARGFVTNDVIAELDALVADEY